MYSLQAHREHVGRQIKAARLGAGLTLDELAATIGSTRQHLIKLEQGRHLPKPPMLTKIAAATGKDLAFFDSETAAA